ncbi:General transcription factor IIH subunit 1 [Eumeta japonica]|uniref:General transcription factor IIH subunit 1 n=1 Tax=Eumeta variegata TaxID=151549 RepID=A0A4C1V5V6_EUMVA|nr:General transcription factor IIH subunit 1 [Eumeta japonica]
MILKQGHWVPYELKPRDVERRFLTCELLLQQQKRKGSLHRIATGDEKWIHYDNPKRRKSWAPSKITVYHCFSEFNCGQFMLMAEFEESRPKSVVPQNIDAVRELIMQDCHYILRDKGSPGHKLLSLHPTLKHLYEDLVISKVINSEEYWNTPTLKHYTESNNIKQEVGVSGAFLADIQPQTDGCNGLKYNLTQDIIDAIFKTYPAVRKKHTDYVPTKMTEAEFWTKFFQSHYFHRDRIASSSSKDLFGECAKMDDVAIATAMKHTTPDLTVDLPQFIEPTPLLGAPDEESERERDNIHRNMIKRFNQHSIMVLKASQKSTNSNSSNKVSNSKPVENGIAEKRPVEETTTNGNTEPPEKKRRILEKIHYEDLEDNNKNDDTQELQLSKIERYLLGPSSQLNQSNIKPKHAPPLSALASVVQAWSSGQGCARPVRASAAAAVGALGELSPGGALMRHHHAASMAQLVPPDVNAELHRLYLSCGELLRELWRCFPQPGAAGASANDAGEDTAARAAKFYEALLRFRNVKLRPFEEKMLRDLTPLAATLTKHLNQMIETACSKYAVWQQRQAKLR